MFNKIKKNLIHFSTSGNVTEDFVASRREKTRKIRQVIKACFYVHCGAALLCIAAAFLLTTGKTAVFVTLATLVTAWISFFASGNNMPLKIVLCIADFVFGTLFVTMGTVYTEKVLILCGIFAFIAGLFAVASYIAALCRKYLNEVQPKKIRRTDYTRYEEPVLSTTTENITEETIEDIPSLPPLTSDMRLLADKLRDILYTDNDK